MNLSRQLKDRVFIYTKDGEGLTEALTAGADGGGGGTELNTFLEENSETVRGKWTRYTCPVLAYNTNCMDVT